MMDAEPALRLCFRSQPKGFAKTEDKLYVSSAIDRIGGFTAHYGRIPGIAAGEVNELKRQHTKASDLARGSAHGTRRAATA